MEKRSELDAIVETVRSELVRNLDGGAFGCLIQCDTDDHGEWAYVTVETRRRFEFELPVGPKRPT